jgi:hypothetical protein
MSATYTVGVFRKPGDERNKEEQYKDFLRLQAKITAQEEQANKQYLLNQSLDIQPLPQKQLTFQEKQQNIVLQRQNAMKNLKDIMDVEEANRALSEMNDSTVLFFNNNFEDIKKQLKGRVVGHLFLRQFLQDYLLRFGLTNETGIAMEQVGTERILANIQDMLAKAFRQAGIAGIEDDGDDGDDFQTLQRNLLQRLASFDRKQLAEYQALLERMIRSATTIQRIQRGRVGRRRALTRAQEIFREQHERAIQEIMQELEAQRLANEQLGMTEEDIDATVRRVRENALRQAFEGPDRRMARNVLERLRENVEEEGGGQQGLDFRRAFDLADEVQSQQSSIIPTQYSVEAQQQLVRDFEAVIQDPTTTDRDINRYVNRVILPRLGEIEESGYPVDQGFQNLVTLINQAGNASNLRSILTQQPSPPPVSSPPRRLTPGQRFMMSSSQIRAMEGEQPSVSSPARSTTSQTPVLQMSEPDRNQRAIQRGLAERYNQAGSRESQSDAFEAILTYRYDNPGMLLIPELAQIINIAQQDIPPTPSVPPGTPSQISSAVQGEQLSRDLQASIANIQQQQQAGLAPSEVGSQPERTPPPKDVLTERQDALVRQLSDANLNRAPERDIEALEEQIANLYTDLVNRNPSALTMSFLVRGQDIVNRVEARRRFPPVGVPRTEQQLEESITALQRRIGERESALKLTEEQARTERTQRVKKGLEDEVRKTSDEIRKLRGDLRREEEELNRRFPKKGGGMKGFGYSKVSRITPYNKYNRILRHGKGLVVDDDDHRYRMFGRYLIHVPSLYNGYLNIKHSYSLANHKDIPRVRISRSTVDFLEDMMEHQTFDKKDFSRLPKKDQEILLNAFHRSNLASKFGIRVRIMSPEHDGYHADEDEEEDVVYSKKESKKKNETTTTEQDDIKRFKLVQGQLIAGNNNPEIIKELKGLVEKFMKNGVLDHGSGMDLLKSIEVVVV